MGKHVLPNGVTLHCDWNDPWLPSIDVKMGLWNSERSFPDADDVVARTACCAECAQQAIESAFDVHQGQFWLLVDKLATQIFGVGVHAGAMGHSGGWCSVMDIGEGEEVEKWDDKMLGKWRHFEEDVRRLIGLLCEFDYVMATIDSNGWLQGCHLLIEQQTMGMGGEL